MGMRDSTSEGKIILSNRDSVKVEHDGRVYFTVFTVDGYESERFIAQNIDGNGNRLKQAIIFEPIGEMKYESLRNIVRLESESTRVTIVNPEDIGYKKLVGIIRNHTSWRE